METSPQQVTKLLVDWSNGDLEALEQLTPLVYGELRRLAARYLRKERPDHTLAEHRPGARSLPAVDRSE